MQQSHYLRRSPRLTLSPPQPPPPSSTSLALALRHHAPPHDHHHLDFLTPEPLNIFHPKRSKNGGNARVLLLDSATGGGARRSLRRSPRLLAESAGVATGKCGSNAVLVKLPDSTVSEKKACELARSCLGESDFKVRCLRSRKLDVPSHLAAGGGSTSSSGKRKVVESEEDREGSRRSKRREIARPNPIALLEFKEERVLRRSPRSSVAENVAGTGQELVVKRSTRSSVADNVAGTGRELVVKRSTRSSVADNGGRIEEGRGLRRSPRSSVAENGKGMGPELGLRHSSVVENVGGSGRELGLKRSPRSSVADNVEGTGKELVLRCSPRSSVVVDNVEGTGRELVLRCSPRSSKVDNVGRIEDDRVLRRSPRSCVADNIGKIDPSTPIVAALAGNVGKSRGEKRLLICGTSSSMVDGSKKLEGGRQLRSCPKSSMPRLAMSEDVGKIEESVLRRLRSLPSSYVEDRFDNNEPLERKSIDETEGKSGLKAGSESMEGSMERVEEDMVLRRSPRGLPSSLMVNDDENDDEIEMLVKRKKKKMVKERNESKSSPIEKKEKRYVSGKCFFVGEPVSEEEAQLKWARRYDLKNRRIRSRGLTAKAEEEDEPILKVKCHYTQAQIYDRIFHLGEFALIRGDGGQKHIGRIIEFFKTMEEEDYFRVQWFYKAEDTVMKEEASFHDKKRIFYSTIENDNLLDCIISKLKVTQLAPELNLDSSALPPFDYYYDMEYCLEFSTFCNLPRENCIKELPSVNCLDSVVSVTSSPVLESTTICDTYGAELVLLDLYAGCGAMSTGLCIGARRSGAKLVTRWAIDVDSTACESLRLNHSEAQVRNEAAEDFLQLLKHWEKLCKQFVTEDVEKQYPLTGKVPDLAADAQSGSDIVSDSEELEVLSLVDICYGNPDGSRKRELKFKVRWKGYGPDDDTWEPVEGLSNCQELIQDFVISGFKNKILPLPGDVDVICGGPPCQGISGYNRHRCTDNPLADERNRQLVVFMDIVDYLKPKFVLMENVMDILRFDKGSLGRYALSRLVHMKYQARVGMMAAGCYGIPQFRLRVFFWGALPSEELPQFPLPTHDVVVRNWPPTEFERHIVAYEEGQPLDLEDAVFLGDAISDLPVVTNFESLDEMPYSRPPETEFQKYIRSTDYVMIGSTSKAEEPVLYDHRPHMLFEDDYVRVRKIPQKKGANFRDLPGIVVGDDNVVRRDPNVKTLLLPSGRPMVPDYTFTFEQGKSKRPFGRLWWDETIPTVITYPNCHSQAVLHPEQDRVLTVRECARLQGFPDSYRFCGTVKQRYRQVGNAVAIPVAKALGYALGIASLKLGGKESVLTLPPKFAYTN